jgi:hypothetical protein
MLPDTISTPERPAELELEVGSAKWAMFAARPALGSVPMSEPSSYDEMIEYFRDAAGFVAAPWCGRRECEIRVKGDSSAISP